ncbi:glycosyltransferase [Mannheimia sp. HC-2023]|uniref:glycosyltransferase n=1 Tax=Mannheimia indoligenes TaxID=3103145 RepID=UPI002FE50667
MNYKISIIISVYNVENYLSRCLHSLVSAEVKSEIIIVNDGSTDKSLEIAKDFQNRFTDLDIKIVSQANKGLSSARNMGLEIAKGEYVYFIDSDDFIDPLQFKSLLEETIAESLDIGIGRFLYWGKSTIVKLDEVKEGISGVATGEEYLNFLRPEVWIKLYRLEFLKQNNLRFVENVVFEDEIFNLNSMLKAERVKQFDQVFYFYYQRPSSITHQMNEELRLEHYYHLAEAILKIKDDFDEGTRQSIVIKRAWGFLWDSLQKVYWINKTSFEERRKRASTMLSFFATSNALPDSDRKLAEVFLSPDKIIMSKGYQS